MNIGFYNPYFDGFGGGERYTLTLASHWSKKHDVSLFWDDSTMVKKSEDRFGLDLTRVKTVPNIFASRNLFTKALETKKYDLIYFLSDGSVPFSLARYNLLHFQVPFSKVHTTPFHLSRISSIICNSVFTKNNLDARLRNKAIVIYPPTELVSQSLTDIKSKIILSVGRFTGFHTAKKQHELINAYISIEKKLKGWRLVFCGGLLESDEAYFQSLLEMAKGHAIDFFPNVSYLKILQLYKKASLYWHAAGFGETNPQYMEHFGISTVEAMSAGLIPLVYKGGGQTEIVYDNKNGFLWNTVEELCDKTVRIISNHQEFQNLSNQAIETSKKFTTNVFIDSFDALLSRIDK